MKKVFATAFASLSVLAGLIHAVETPYLPYRDGHANSSNYSGIGRTLTVRAGDSKAWVVHALGDGIGDGLIKARLSVYVKDVTRDGSLRVYLASPIKSQENVTRLETLKNGDSLGTAAVKAVDNVQGMISIGLEGSFIKSVKAGTFSGLILEGADGLDAEIGAIEGSHGAVLYLEYATGGAKLDSIVLDSIAARVVGP